MIEGEYLLEAVQTTLRNGLTQVTKIEESVKITANEKADNASGREFMGIFSAGYSNVYPPEHIAAKFVFSINVGLTMRLAAKPLDRIGNKTIVHDDLVEELKPSMMKRAGQINSLIDGSQTLIAIANSKLQSGECPFLAPLGFESDSGEIIYVEEEHFFNTENKNVRPEGVYLELLFSGAYIIRPKG